MAEPNVNLYGIFEIRTRRTFILEHNIQGVPFKKVEVAYILQFYDAFMFPLITSKDSIDKTLQLLYTVFFCILNNKGSRQCQNLIKDPEHT